jgi:hypothetical protein
MKGFAEAGQNLAFLNRETGLSVNLLRQLDAAGEHLGGNMDSINQGFAKFAGITEQLRMNRTPGGIVDLLGHDTTGSLHRLVETLRHETDSTKALFDALGELPNIKSIQQRKAFLSDLGIDQVFANYTPSMLAEVKKNLGDVPEGAIENAVALKDAFDAVGDSIKKIKDDIDNYVSSPLTKALNLLREFMQQHEGATIGLSTLGGCRCNCRRRKRATKGDLISFIEWVESHKINLVTHELSGDRNIDKITTAGNRVECVQSKLWKWLTRVNYQNRNSALFIRGHLFLNLRNLCGFIVHPSLEIVQPDTL